MSELPIEWYWAEGYAIFFIWPVLYFMCFSTWFGFYDFEFFFCFWLVDPGVDDAF